MENGHKTDQRGDEYVEILDTKWTKDWKGKMAEKMTGGTDGNTEN